MEKRVVVLDPTLLEEVEPAPEIVQTFQVCLSIYDIPQEVQATEDARGILHIDFVYVDKEEEVREAGEGQVVLRTGRHSGKLLGMDVPVRDHGNGANRIELLSRQIHDRIPKLKRPNQRLNYRLIENVLQRKGEELVIG